MLELQIDDYLLPVVYAGLILLVGAELNKRMIRRELQRFFMLGLILKLCGAVLFACIYLFYFKVGDSFYYYDSAALIWNCFLTDPALAADILVLGPGEYEDASFHITRKLHYFNDPNDWLFTRITALFLLLCYNNYLCITLIFGTIGFIGSWLIFKTLTDKYGKHNHFFTLIFLIPSCLIWTTGLLKDTVCLSVIGLTFYLSSQSAHRLSVLKKFLGISFSLTLIISLKPYLGYCVIISALPLVFLNGSWIGIHGMWLQVIKGIAISLIVIGAFSFGYIVNTIESTASFQTTMKVLKGYHQEYSNEGTENKSKYTLGEIQYTVEGLLQKTPDALETGLFRPFVWNTNSSLSKFMSLETSAYLLFLLIILFNPRFWENPRVHLNNKEVLFGLLFTTILAILVGLTSYNYGLLMRLKSPLLPFFGAALYLIYLSINEQRFNSFSNEEKKSVTI